MRIHRISLAHYRGVTQRTVQLDPAGVTIVSGPNEAGKTSLAEALRVVLRELDRTKKQDVRAIQPVHRDRGSEIEVELETGPYRFTYFKRFHRERETRLVVTKPEPASLRGQDAHDRVLAMLDETLDRALWDALCIEQDTAGAQPDLSAQHKLSEALERAAGTVEGSTDETLLEAARRELLIYYTEKQRRPTRVLAEPGERLARCRAELDRARAELAEVESAAERASVLARELAELAGREARASEQAEALRREWEAVRALAAERSARRAERAGAERDVEALRREQERRSALAARVASAERALAEARRTSERTAHEVERMEGALAELGRERARSAAAAEAAQRLLALREADAAHVDACRRRDVLHERERALAALDGQLETARDALAELRVDERALREIRRAQRRVEHARAARDASAPRVSIEALRPIEVVADGESRALEPGERVERIVDERVELVIGDAARVALAAGEPAEEARRSFDEAEERLAALCRANAVRDLRDAERGFDTRRELVLRVEQLGASIRTTLDGATRGDLAADLRELEASVAAYPRERAREPTLARDAAEAAALRDEARSAHETAWRAHSKAELAFDMQREALEDARKQAPRAAQRLREESESAARARAALEAAAAERSDRALESAIEVALRTLDERTRALAAAETKLDGVEPARVERRARDAQDALDALRETRDRLREEWSRLDAVLTDRGERGLAERVDRLESEAHFAERERARTERRARAAALLYDVLVSERDRSRRSYQTPLRERIESLGREVFGDTLRVELGEDLTIRSRTLEGRTVPWDSLSAGAREQLALIARLASAMLVSEDDGVPLLLDDALAHSDPERSAALCRVLALAGHRCQVIVLTCTPERYGALEVARRVDLTA